MNKKIGVVLAIGLLLGAIGGGGAYAYLTFFDTSYKKTYTFEEINSEVFSFQQQAISKLEEKFKREVVDVKDGFESSWNMHLNLGAKTMYGSGKVDLNIENYKTSNKDNNLEVEIQNLFLEIQWLPPWNAENEMVKIPEMHLITNPDGKYVKSSEIEYSQNIWNMIPDSSKALIITFNSFAKSGKYIEFPQDVKNSLGGATVPIMSQTNFKFQKNLQYIFDVLKNEPLLEVNKQEGTRYYLVPSKQMCKLDKYQKEQKTDQKASSEPEKYDQQQFAALPECWEEEYQSFIQGKMQKEENIFEVYYEKSKVKKHYVWDAKNKNYQTRWEMILGLVEMEYLKIESTPIGEWLTGSGLLIESQNKSVSGYFDLGDESKWEKINMIFSPTAENVVWIEWTFVIETSSGATQKSGVPVLSIVKFPSHVNWEVKWTVWLDSLDIAVTAHTQQERLWWGISKIDTSLDMHMLLSENEKSGSISISYLNDSLKDESSGKILWIMKKNGQQRDSKVELVINIPKMITAELLVEWKNTITREVTSTFQTPKETISAKLFENFLKINQKKLQKEKQLEMEKLMEEVRVK